MLSNVLQILFLLSTTLALTGTFASSFAHDHQNRHSGIVVRAAGHAQQLAQRDSKFSNARLTYYDVGLCVSFLPFPR